MSTLREPNFYMYVSKNAAQKKIKGIVFKRDVPTPVWDIKTDKLIRRLPYMRPAESPFAQLPLGPAPQPLPEIPDDWRKAHHKRRMAWAGALSKTYVRSAAEADAIIARHKGEPAELAA